MFYGDFPQVPTIKLYILYLKSSDAKASCYRMAIFIKLVYLSSVISLK